ncbi:pyridoxamine 5'-phosphate oxidase family protein [Halogeometricum limi]|nr:pyridoxamine 5'-phosphate oxidase family protein [Halogeometricum limi]
MDDEYSSFRGNRMDEADVDEFLRSQGVGVLSLADDGEAYGVPLSFGYDGERLYFVYLRPEETSKKEAFAAETQRASFTCFDAAGKHDWRSVVVEGSIRPIADDEWSTLSETMAENAWFPSLFSEVEPMQDILGWVLDIESATGLRNRA